MKKIFITALITIGFLGIINNAKASIITLPYGGCMNQSCTWQGYNNSSSQLIAGNTYIIFSTTTITNVNVYDFGTNQSDSTSSITSSGVNYWKFVLPQNHNGTYGITAIGFNGNPPINLGTTLNFTLASPATIDFVYPTSTLGFNMTYANDFSHWEVRIDSGAGYCGTPIVKFGTTSSSLNWSSTGYGNCITSGVTGNVFIRKNRANTGNLYAQTYIINSQNQIIASSSIINFTIQNAFIENTNGTSTIGINPVATTTLASTTALSGYFEVDCSQYDDAGFFSSSTLASLGCQAKKVFMYVIGALVVPPDFLQGYLTDSYNAIKGVFPFNMAFQIIDTYQNSTVNAETQASQNLNLNLPQIGLSTTVLSSTTLSDEIGSSTASQVFAVERSIIWVITAIAITTILL